MTSQFDFSTYRYAPKGWKILKAEDELWLHHVASDRTYYITSEIRGEYELFYTSIMQKEREFVMRAAGIYECLRRCGLLMPQPSQPKNVRLTIRKNYL